MRNNFIVAQKIYLFTIGILLFCTPFKTNAQELRNPMSFPILLSGNFGELRSNHFHAGIDFKTQGVEGKPIHAVQGGYVSRISVSPGGYGNALYLDHPDGTTTVYGHILRFSNKITAYVKEKQYEQESFTVNLSLSLEQIPVEEGEVIALSGNTGSSEGPHLHFEVRDTKSEHVLDPIVYFKKQLKDTRSPKIQGIMIYPIGGEGVVNGRNQKQELKLITAKDGTQIVSGKVEAWGKIGLAIKAYDYMDNTNNTYGIKETTLTVDNQDVVFRSYIDRFSFDESRYLNNYVDYEEWINKRSFYMKSFLDPGNRLRFIDNINRGVITINEARTYQLTYKLTDAFGNSTRLSIWIEGKKQDIPALNTQGTEHFHWTSENKFGNKGVRLSIMRGNLYNDLYFKYAVKEDSLALSATHTLHNTPVALHRNAQLSIRLQHDLLENKKKYGIIRIDKGKRSWIEGTYRKGWIDANIRELGTYAIAQDTIPPTITPLDMGMWGKRERITFRVSDNLSGVSTYRGEINGQYVLFEMNNRSVITYHFDKERLKRGKHSLKLLVTDACGNESTYTHTFSW